MVRGAVAECLLFKLMAVNRLVQWDRNQFRPLFFLRYFFPFFSLYTIFFFYPTNNSILNKNNPRNTIESFRKQSLSEIRRQNDFLSLRLACSQLLQKYKSINTALPILKMFIPLLSFLNILVSESSICFSFTLILVFYKPYCARMRGLKIFCRRTTPTNLKMSWHGMQVRATRSPSEICRCSLRLQ